MVREGVFEEASSGSFADDAPVEQFVERIGEGRFVPCADLAHGVARKAVADAGGNLGGRSRVFGEPFDAARDDRLQRNRLAVALAFPHLGNELREEERVSLRRGDQRFGGAIAHVGQRRTQFFNIGDRERAQPHALRTGDRARLPPQTMKGVQPLRLLVAIGNDDHDAHAGDASQQELQQLDRCRLRPMKVFEDQQQRARLREIGDASEKRFKETNSLALGVQPRYGRERDARVNLGQKRCHAGKGNAGL